MRYFLLQPSAVIRFRRFERKGYSAFSSMHKIVNIGMVAAGTLLFALNDSAHAQEVHKQQSSDEKAPIELMEVEVTASRAPIALNKAAKMVTVISAADIQAAPVTSVQDLLEYAVGVDVRQRGENGTQADISIRGGTFDQIAVLLNGVNLSNPQTGHYSFDIPVNLSDIERIEVVSGPSSRIFGASAFAGAINIITKPSKENTIVTDAYGGMHGLWKLEAGVNQSSAKFAQRFSAGYSSSDGYMKNTDSKQLNLFWQSQVNLEDSRLDFQAGYNDKGYGANGFYSPAYPNQYDRTRRFFFSAGAETAGKIRLTPRIYWTRHFDRYELFRSQPADGYKGPNYHETEVYGAILNATTDWALGRTIAGVEFRNEGVRSNLLGKPLSKPIEVPFEKDKQYTKSDNRTNISYFLEHNIRLDRLTLSAGVLANYNSSLHTGVSYYPGVDISYLLGEHVRVYGNWNKALRMPTFTDLYYEGKTNKGNPDLTPEKSEAFELGFKYHSKALQASLSGFYRKGKNMIDWVKEKPEELWQSRNITKLDNIGLETNVTLLPQLLINDRFFIRKIEIGYAYIYQHKDSKQYISNYALNYLRHKFTAQLNHSIWKGITATWYARWQDRAGSYTKYIDYKGAYQESYAPYLVVDAKINWQFKAFNIYMEANNLLNKHYYDLGNLPQAGFWLKAGFKYTFKY